MATANILKINDFNLTYELLNDNIKLTIQKDNNIYTGLYNNEQIKNITKIYEVKHIFLILSKYDNDKTKIYIKQLDDISCTLIFTIIVDHILMDIKMFEFVIEKQPKAGLENSNNQ